MEGIPRVIDGLWARSAWTMFHPGVRQTADTLDALVFAMREVFGEAIVGGNAKYVKTENMKILKY